MRIFLMFNEFSDQYGRVGRGHVRITLKLDQKMTEDVVLHVEREAKKTNGYPMFVITGWQELEA